MSANLKHTQIGEWHAIELQNDALRLIVLPELGGKIISLKSLPTGREWLWSNPHIPLAKPPLVAKNFGLYDCGGWDEIFPTVDPCSVPDSAWGERRLTDHGELWQRPWQILPANSLDGHSAELKLAVDDAALPFRFERTLKLDSEFGRLLVGYDVINRSDMDLPYIWAAHLLIAIENGDQIVLPQDTVMSSTGNVGLSLANEALPFNWPKLKLAAGEVIDLSIIPDCSVAFAIKLFAENVTPPAVGVIDKTGGERLQISFGSPIKGCGLWLNCGAWSGADTPPYFNLGIEPTSTLRDNLKMACQEKLAATIPPFSRQQWQFEIAVQ